MNSRLTAALAATILSGSLCFAQTPGTTKKLHLKAYTTVFQAADKANVQKAKRFAATATADANGMIPLWSYDIASPRDQNFYTGVMVGSDPYSNPKPTLVPTFIVPIVFTTHSIGTGVDKAGNIISKAGKTMFDPTVADKGCLVSPNNVPLRLLQQSPLFQYSTFDFGGQIVGTTQYVDAYQRANFWNVLGNFGNGYHVLLNPVKTLPAIYLNVPADRGTTLGTDLTGGCGALGIVDINWFYNTLLNSVLPKLAAYGVTAKSFPFMTMHNLVFSGTPNSLADCCILGFHGSAGFPIQTFGIADFEDSGAFTGIDDVHTASHEIAEWMDDPFGNNLTPAWGDVGQTVGFCQNNLENGDPLTGTDGARITMPNGFTYHLQELAFFSWFFGGTPTGIHNWYSNNYTFTTDAGPVCGSTP